MKSFKAFAEGDDNPPLLLNLHFCQLAHIPANGSVLAKNDLPERARRFRGGTFVMTHLLETLQDAGRTTCFCGLRQ